MGKRVWILGFFLFAVAVARGQDKVSAQDLLKEAAQDAAGTGKGGVLSATAPPERMDKPVAAYLDISYVFKNHPWTNLTKAALQETLRQKAEEIDNAKKDIAALNDEIAALENFTDSLKPYYETRYSQDGPRVLPKPQNADVDENADGVCRGLVFSGADIRFNSPIDSAALAEENNKKISGDITAVRDKEVWIDKQKFDTTNKVKEEEAVEVQDILRDIYEELKIYAQKRNIAIIVNKTDILYGQKPFDITQDFTERLKKTKKEKKSKTDSKKIINIELDAQKAPQINKDSPTVTNAPAVPAANNTAVKK